jgi:hypothetical protein
MSIQEFKKLRELNQLRMVGSHGVFLAERTDPENRYVLYQLDGFYIEFVYGHPDPCLKAMDAFTGTALLDPYLNDIRIPFPF